MKGLVKICRLTLVALALTMPSLAQGKWSKASTSFEYDGVRVKVIDRHEFVGHLMNTYGYAIYKNNNDEPVTVNWRSYGVLRNGGKLVMLDDKSFGLQAGEEQQQVYSYGAGRFSHQSFTKYLIAIEVKKGVLPPEAEGTPVPDTGELNDEKAERLYQLIMKHQNDCKVTQQDYSDAIDWMNYTLKNHIGPYWDELNAQIQRTGDASDLVQANAAKFQQWKQIVFFLASADAEGRLNSENKARYEQLTADIQKWQ